MANLQKSTLSYVRTEMLPQAHPPLRDTGIIKWMRENLFSGVMNTVLTVLGTLAVVLLIYDAFPWFMRSVWVADSLSECRSVIASTWGEGLTGACWAVIRERWMQFLFGFYPIDYNLLANMFYADAYSAAGGREGVFGGDVPREVGQAFADEMRAAIGHTRFYVIGYGRPILTFLLLFVALMPVLYDRIPRQFLWLSAFYPATAFWLLWGGSIWLPVMVMAGFGLVAVAITMVVGRRGMIVAALVGVAVFLVLFSDPVSPVLNLLSGMAGLVMTTAPALDLGVTIGDSRYALRELFPLLPHAVSAMDAALAIGIDSVASDKFGGFVLSLTIGITAIAFSLPLGILLALGRRSDMLLVKTICVGFIEFIRGVPLITLLFTASLLLNYFLPPGTNFDIVLRVIIMVTLFAAAYIAEVVRGGLAALPRGQFEAADSLGLDYWKAQRLIVMPQALKVAIPGIVSSFIGLFKDTTLVIFVGLLDPLKGITDAVRASAEWNGVYWEPFIFVGALFFIICFGMSRYSMYLERKLQRENR